MQIPTQGFDPAVFSLKYLIVKKPLVLQPALPTTPINKLLVLKFSALVVSTLLTVFLMPLSVHAQVSSFQRDAIANSIRDAAENLDLEQIDELESAKELARERIDDLVEYVNQASSGQQRAGWFEYLDLEPLRSAIEDGESVAKTGRAAVDLKQRLVGLAPGLEFSKFRSLRQAVDRLIPALKYSRKERLKPLLTKKIKSDADDIAEMDSIPTPEEMSTVGDLLALLNETNQSKATTDTIRRSFAQPNLAVWVGEGVVQRVVSRPVNEVSPVNDCILGTSLNGSATLTGNVSADIIPMQGAVGLNVSLAGCVVSRNRGYNKPVSLLTTGYGDVTATRTLYINESGISLAPTFVRAELRTEINQINHRFRLVRRIARRKAAETKPQADRIGVEKLRQRVGEKFAEQTAEAGNVQIPDLMAKALPILQRLDFPEPARLIGSTDDSVYLQTTVQRDDQLAAPNAAPPIGRSYDAAIQIHESAINNTVGYLLAGRTITQKQIDSLMSQAGRPPVSEAPTASDADDSDKDEEEKEEEPFEVDFAKSRPIIFEAREGKLRLGIGGTRFAQGKRELKKNVEITAIYVPGVLSDGSVILVREGDVNIDFPGTKRLSISQTATKRAMTKNFANVFPSTLMQQPIVLPQTIKAEALRGQVYRPRLIDAQDGWLTVALQ